MSSFAVSVRTVFFECPLRWFRRPAGASLSRWSSSSALRTRSASAFFSSSKSLSLLKTSFGSRPSRSWSRVSFLIAISALRRRHYGLAHKIPDSPPDGRDRDGDPLSAQQHGDLALAPHRMIGAQPLDRLHERARPRRAADPMRSPALRLYALLPAIQRRPGDPDALRGNGGAQPAAHQKTPALKRVASDRCCA